MPQNRTEIEEQALLWVIRLRDPAFEQWDAFDAWLGAAPAHADAYHAVALADEDVAVLLQAPTPSVVVPMEIRRARRPLRQWAWIGTAMAASVAAVVGFETLQRPTSLYTVETPAGERKTVTLADGTSIAMNGGTRLTFDRDNKRRAVLDSGEAFFTVVHDANDPFRVEVGTAELVDVGTRFNVQRLDGGASVQVAEGAVVYNPDREALRVDAGRALATRDGDAAPALAAVEPEDVAGWQHGRFVYAGQPMAQVAADLSRYFGKPVIVTGKIAKRLFHGVLNLGSEGHIEQLAPLLEVRVTRSGAGWILSPQTP